MRTVVFVAPFFLDTTVRFVGACASLPGVRVGIVCQDPLEKLAAPLRGKIAAHRRVKNALDPQQIADGVRALSKEIGPPERLLGALEDLVGELPRQPLSGGVRPQTGSPLPPGQEQ